MKKALLVIAAFISLASCTVGGEYTYSTQVLRETHGTANWVDTVYNTSFTDNHFYVIGDTLEGLSRDQVVITRK